MTKYISTLALLLALVWVLLGASVQSSFYDSLVSKIGILRGEKVVIQYANVSYCGKIVSVTANHLVDFIKTIKPDAKLLATSDEHDLAIYDILGKGEPSPLTESMLSPFDEVFIPTYVWMNSSVVVYRYPIIGRTDKETLIQGILFFGVSGSGVYNAKGEYIGPVLNILGGPGLGGGHQQVNIGGIGKTDRLLELFKAYVCRD